MTIIQRPSKISSSAGQMTFLWLKIRTKVLLHMAKVTAAKPLTEAVKTRMLLYLWLARARSFLAIISENTGPAESKIRQMAWLTILNARVPAYHAPEASSPSRRVMMNDWLARTSWVPTPTRN